jgi:enoyl-CoA hydratase
LIGEFAHGQVSLAGDALRGAAAFAAGAGRHGEPR